jgi:tetratricopeptide (TPR) repeat protein
MSDSKITDVLRALTLVALVFTVFAVYAPGRYSGFILDDLSNVAAVFQAGQNPTSHLFDPSYGSHGRWLSKLSFLLDSPSWPSDAYRFKQNNILLHIVNGLMVIWVFLSLMRLMGRSERMSQAVALILGTLWLLHPLNTSTALYVVQRMTELSALFMLAGALCYLKGRRIVADRPIRGYIWMSSGLVWGTLLGFLSKENAALLPLLVLTMESILLRKIGAPEGFRYWKAAFLYFPSLALLAWLAYKLPDFMRMGEYRPFDLWERLMTEARVLVDYLRLILIPTREGTGVYHDDFPISRGLLDPPTTLLSVLALGAIIGYGFKYRRRLPVLWFGVAWFFAGHLLESTVVPLEIYFEHRNYVPMLGPLFALCYYLSTARSRLSPFLRGSLVVFTCLAALSTWQNVYVWTDIRTNLETWQKEHPTSARFLQYATNLHAKMGDYDEAEEKLQRLIELNPTWAGPKLELLMLSCQSGENRLDRSMEALLQDLPGAEYDRVSIRIVKKLFQGMQIQPCDALTMDHIGRMIDQLLNNPNYRAIAAEVGNLYSLRAEYNGHLGNHRQQAMDFAESYKWKKSYYTAKAESEVWAALREYDKALEAIERVQKSNYVSLRGFRYQLHSSDLERWKQYIVSLKSLANQSATSN